MIIDSVTGKRIPCAKHVGDIVYDRASESSDDVLINESIPLIGNWSDYTGSGTVSSRQQLMWAGHENTLFGTRAHLEHGAKLPNLNAVGETADTHRRRLKQIYKKLD